MVVHADNIAGPWSAPVDLGLLGHCDPAHVVSEDGTRYLFLNNGYRVPLHADGLSGRGTPRQVYRGWPIPSDFINEGFVLDAVKIVRRDGWFYLFAAEGGGAGPANGHLVSVARARSVDGPWHDSPYNPLVRAEARDDPWWSRGRAVPVEGPDGRWWIIYHSYEKNLRSLGRQMILEPIEWRGDGWPRSLGGLLDVPLRAPAPSSNATHGVALGGPWSAQDLGRRVAIYRPGPADARRVSFERGDLLIAGKGDGPATSSPFAMVAGDRRYEMSVRIEPGGQAEAGLLLFYDHQLFCGLSVIDGSMRRYKLGQPMTWPVDSRSLPGPFHMKIVYKEDVASFFLSQDGHAWSKIMTQEVSGYNVNMTDRPLSLRPALFVAGQGSARFSPLHYNGAL
jgi:beta-xylosidase